MRRGERLVARLQRVGDRELPDKLARDVENWSESTAFFVNFILNGDADDQLLILGFDPRWHEPVDEPSAWDAYRLYLELLMRVTLLRKWFDELMDRLGRIESRHVEIVQILAEEDTPVKLPALQMRMKLESGPLIKALRYLQNRNIIVFDEGHQTVALSNFGRSRRGGALKGSSTRQKTQSRNGDLIFISYARENSGPVIATHRRLSELGFNVWFDEASLIGGQRVKNEIQAAIERASVCLVFLSQQLVDKAGFIHREIACIEDKMIELPKDKIGVIPIRLDDCAIPGRLRDCYALDYRSPQFHNHLVKAIQHALKRRAT